MNPPTAPAAEIVAPRRPAPRVRAVLGWQRRMPVLQIAALAALFVYGACTIDGFASANSIRALLVLAALLGLAAVGQTLVVILGGIDFSVAGYIVFGAVVVTQLCGTHHWPASVAIAVIAAITAALGGATGYICHRFRIQPLVVTLGTGAVAGGGAIAWTHGQFTGTAPLFLTKLTSVTGTTFGLGVPPIVVIWVVLIVVLGVGLHRTVMGRRLYAVGANPAAARLARVPSRRLWTAVFAISAVCCAAVGVLLAGFSGASQTLGDPYLFEGLTAVVLGGTTVRGSQGDYTHTAVGALTLTVLGNILVGKGLSQAAEQVVFGFLILIVVCGYGRERHLRDRI